MKHFYLVILLLVSAAYCAMAQPSPPTPCTSAANPNISISGSTSFTFTTLASFNSTQSSNTIQITCTSKNTAYVLYIAGAITALPASATNTIIPISAFTASASKNGTAPASVTLSNLYTAIAMTSTANGSGKTDTQTITLTLNPTLGGTGAIDTYLQAPGTHTLTLYFYICN